MFIVALPPFLNVLNMKYNQAGVGEVMQKFTWLQLEFYPISEGEKKRKEKRNPT